MAPHLSQDVGKFNQAALRFNFDRYPELSLNFKIESTVIACKFSSVEFSTELIKSEFLIGEADKRVQLPGLKVSPKCGFEPEIIGHSFTIIESPEGVETESLIEFDSDESVLILKQTEDLRLLNQTLSSKVEMTTKEGFQLKLFLSVVYTSNGPSLKENKKFDPLTCSKKDENWSWTLPDMVAAGQQEIQVIFLQQVEYSQIFVYQEANRTLTLT